MDHIWEKILVEVSKTIPPVYYDPFISKLSFITADDERFVVRAPSLSIKNHVDKKYRQFIEEAIYSIKGNKLRVEINFEPDSQVAKTIVVDKFKDESFSFNPGYSFEKFIVGDSNKFAFSAAKEIVKHPGEMNPFYIFGNVGVGKTHLLHSIGSKLMKEHPWQTVKYIDILSFMSEFIYTVQNRQTMESFKIKYQSYNTLIVDDIQYLNSGAEKTQEIFFTLFNFLYERKRQIIIASDRPSSELPIHERLKSRFVNGVQADIKTPDFNVRYGVLKLNSDNLGLNLSEETIKFIAEKLKTDTRTLIGSLNDIYLYKKTNGLIFIDHNLVKEIIESRIRTKEVFQVTGEKVINSVCKYFSQSAKDVLSKSRKKEFVLPRHVCMYLLHEVLKENKTVIGRMFSTTHTTVIHAINSITESLKKDENLNSAVLSIRSELEFQ
ncbi:MAG: chromosomal replication initiator protein DnaA [Leptospira sp.]|nr:chromosomal replication initiator protein DnaA [Leptospira sp.]